MPPKRKVRASPRSKAPNVLDSPTFRRIISVEPRRSPEKSISRSPERLLGRSPKNIDIIGKKPDLSMLSPSVTPRGRRGRASPERRTSADLDMSAQKRAWNTKISSRLLDDDDDEDVFNEQDLAIAEKIIEDSRIDSDDSRAYGSDVELEEDLTDNESPTRPQRKAGRARRAAARKLTFKDSDVEDNESDDSVVPEDEEDEEDEEPEQEESDDEAEEPISSDEERGSPSKKRKRGRPRLSDNDDGYSSKSPTKRYSQTVKSIFAQDDEDFFSESQAATATSSKKTTPETTEQPEVDWSLMHDKIKKKISRISGIPLATGEAEREVEKESTGFQAFPVPRLDNKGEVTQAYMEKHLKGIGFESKTDNQVLDERAYFYEGTEGYFDQKSNRDTHSVKSLAQLNMNLDYQEFADYLEALKYVSASQRESLVQKQQNLFHQWCFELSQGFNIEFYGLGSKIDILAEFAESYVFDWYEKYYPEEKALPNVLVINGYNPSLKLKETIKDIVDCLLTPEEREAANVKFPKLLSESVPILVNYFKKHRKVSSKPTPPRMVLVIHNIDGDTMRHASDQNYLSQLCSIPEVWLLASSDTINISLFWDSYKQKNYNFVWHDVTNFQPYTRELSFKDMLKLGKSKKFIGNRGTKFVLRSLTENSKKLYEVLLKLQMAQLRDAKAYEVNSSKGNLRQSIAFKELYAQCAEQFITSNELNFRTMLGEFVEHQMCKLQKNDAGTEVVFVPYTYSEMGKIMKEVYSK